MPPKKKKGGGKKDGWSVGSVEGAGDGGDMVMNANRGREGMNEWDPAPCVSGSVTSVLPWSITSCVAQSIRSK